MEIRQACADEIPELKRRLSDSGGEQIDLDRARVFVAVENGRLVGMMALRMCWQAEPLLIFPEVNRTHTRRRVGLGLYRFMESWIAGPDNRTSIRWLFAVVRRKSVKGWLPKLGWFQQYRGASTFLKYL